MAKLQCKQTLDSEQCVGEEGHPGWHFFGNNVRMLPNGNIQFVTPKPPLLCSIKEPEEITWAFKYSDGSELNDPTLQLGYGVGETDPLKLPLSPIATNADWSTKDRQIEWVRANFTSGMLAKMFKLSYDADGLRRDKCDEIIRKG